MNDVYFFVDGSSLLGDINRLRQKNKNFRGHKLDAKKFYEHFVGGSYSQFVGGGYKRFAIYFVTGENRIKDYLVIPSFRTPNFIEDFHITYVGKKVAGANKVQTWLDSRNSPQYVMDRFNKSEKAVDTKICCDALQLAANNRLERLFLYTNDFDFMPLLDTLKSMGCNVSLMRLLSQETNAALVENADSFCVPSKSQVERLFGVET